MNFHKRNKIKRYAYYINKRLFDIIISLFILILFSPILILCLILSFIETGKNPIYLQKRALSLSGKVITIFKIRTMIPKEENKELHTNSEILIKDFLSNEVTKSGKWMRKTGLDELPQLINVLIGNMSIIGPRPLSLSDLQFLKKNYPKYHKLREKIKSKPGITGYWQIFGERREGIKNLIEYDIYYENNKSTSLDLFLFMMTVPLVLFAQHSDAIITNLSEKKESSLQIDIKKSL